MKSISKSLTNIRRTPYQSMAAVLVLTIAFFIGIVVSFVMVGIYQTLSYFEKRPQAIIFFQNNVSEEAILMTKTSFEANPQVETVTYIPQEEALSIYKELNKNDPKLLELVTADILPASLEVSTTNLEALKTIAEESKDIQGVDEVVLRTDVVDILNKWLNGIKIFGVVLLGLMTFTSILIVGIVVGMKISRKQYEIRVLRLIGAKNWYIISPFLIEGALYGVVSAILSYILAVTLLLYSSPFVLQFAGEIPLLPMDIPIMATIFFSSLGLATFIGTLGSFLAVKRFTNK